MCQLYMYMYKRSYMVLRSEGSLKLVMLSLARTSKYVDNTSVFRINKTEEDS